MLKGLFYNTSPLGMGHLFRSINLCKGLTQRFHLDFLQGSPAPLPLPQLPNFTVIPLPPLIQENIHSPLIDANGLLPLEEVLEQRIAVIEKEIGKYDFFIAEQFPLGRFFLVEEIMFIINLLKQRNPACLITGSFRGDKVLPPALKPWLEVMLRDICDCIFIHTDPHIAPCKPIVNLFPELKDKFKFTGYVSDPFFQYQPKPRKKQILISMGGGTYGSELILALLETASLLPEYQWIFILGSKTSPALTAAIEEAVEHSNTGNILSIPFTPCFLELLSESALSISFGGAGTFVDLLQTRTPAIIYPHPSQDDQIARRELILEKQIATVIGPQDFTPARLLEVIRSTLEQPMPEHAINISGAQTTTDILFKLLSSTL